MKNIILVLFVSLLAFSACKTKKNFVVREEVVTVVNAAENDVAYKYYVILGSFIEMSNALNFNDKLKTKGFNSPILLKSETGNYRVSVFSSDSENEARAKINSILDIYPEYNDVWLLIKK